MMFRAPVKLAGIVTAARVPLGIVPLSQLAGTCHTALFVGRKTAVALTFREARGAALKEPDVALRL